LNENKSKSIFVTLTPLYGKYKILASRHGKIPTENDNDFMSTNNHL